jgi:hypothetical protein
MKNIYFYIIIIVPKIFLLVLLQRTFAFRQGIYSLACVDCVDCVACVACVACLACVTCLAYVTCLACVAYVTCLAYVTCVTYVAYVAYLHSYFNSASPRRYNSRA